MKIIQIFILKYVSKRIKGTHKMSLHILKKGHTWVNERERERETYYLIRVNCIESLDVLAIKIPCNQQDNNSRVLRWFWKEWDSSVMVGRDRYGWPRTIVKKKRNHHRFINNIISLINKPQYLNYKNKMKRDGWGVKRKAWMKEYKLFL